MSGMNVFEAVKADLDGRDAIGWAQNRRPLLANDGGRDWLQEAYEEALDMGVYLKGALMERELQRGGMRMPSAPVRRLRELSLGLALGLLTFTVVQVAMVVLRW